MKLCKNCGRQLPDDATFCPVCGRQVGEDQNSAVNPAQYLAAGSTNDPTYESGLKLAKTSAILGVLSIIALAPLGIPAIVLASKSKEKTNGVMTKQAKTGMIFGILALIFWGIMLIVYLSSH